MMDHTAPVVLATTTAAEDDALAAVAVDRGVPVVRGPVDDVLRRFVMTARRFGAKYIVRATADNPAVDIDAPRRTLGALVGSGADYVVETGLPYGACVEAMTAAALDRADAMATAVSDREHVTPLLRRHSSFRAIEVAAPIELRRPDLRLTVDTAEDLNFLRTTVGPLYDLVREPPLKAVIYAADTVACDELAVAS